MGKSSDLIPATEVASKHQLNAMKRNELDELASSLGVPHPKTIRNKDELMMVIREQQEILTVDEGNLTPKQEEFCRLYASDKEFFGNGTQAYVEAYDINLANEGAYASARTCAHRLLTNVDILARINEYLSEVALNDAHVDKQMAFLITQNADLNAKNQAIKEYNRVKKRVEDKLPEGGNTYHLTQNNFNVGTPDGEQITDDYLNFVLEQTKGKLVGRAAKRQSDNNQAAA